MNTLLIFAKYPEPGKVKTRLGNDIGLELSCEFYKIFLALTFKIAKSVDFDCIKVYYAPENKGKEFRELVPPEFKLMPQSGSYLGAKLHNAFDKSFNEGAKKVVIIGSDSPTLPSLVLSDAVKELNCNDLLLGPAADGGYYLIGAKKAYEFLFSDIDWGTASVLRQTLKKAKQNKLKHHLLPEWYDVDDLQFLKKAQKDDNSGLIAQLINKHPAIFPLL